MNLIFPDFDFRDIVNTGPYDPRVFFKNIFLVFNAAYFVVREEGMRWGGKTRMEEKVTDDRRFLSYACLEPKVERDQDGLHS